MLSKDLDLRLTYAVTDEKIADEIGARLIDTAPADEAEALAILALLNSSYDSAIEERMIIALAGDGAGAAGREVANKINGLMAVLEKFAELDALPPADPEEPETEEAIEAAEAALASAKMAANAGVKMSASTKYSLIHALADEKAALEFEEAYNAMDDVIDSL